MLNSVLWTLHLSCDPNASLAEEQGLHGRLRAGGLGVALPRLSAPRATRLSQLRC